MSDPRFDVLVLDGRHLLWRAASVFWDLHTMVGEKRVETGGMYGFLRIALGTWIRFGGIVWVAWDTVDGPAARRAVFSGYKNKPKPVAKAKPLKLKVPKEPQPDPIADEYEVASSRPPSGNATAAQVWREITREAMVEQEVMLKDILQLIGVLQADAPGWEADDVIANVCGRFGDRYKVGIVSGDRDLLQLVSDNVSLLRPMPKGEFKVETPATVQAEHGVSPRQILDLKALAGDPGDNIPGAAGIGAKGAAKLISEHGGWEQALIAAAQALEPTNTQRKLLASANNVRMSARLAALNPKVRLRHISPTKDGRAVFLRLTQLKMSSLIQHGQHEQLMKMGPK